jgi:NAD+ synthase (glutamine-hydrolysing)
MSTEIQIAIAQVNLTVGDIEGNTLRVLEESRSALSQGADIIVFPELTLTSYPPEDLLLRPSLDLRITQALNRLTDAALDIHIVIGYPKRSNEQLFNMAGVFYRGRCVIEYAKQSLPNYQVFDEKRYFQSGTDASCFDVKDVTFGLCICEDIWRPEPAIAAKNKGAQGLLVLNASPFHIDKSEDRLAAAAKRVQETNIPLVYANLVGGQDELIFDGSSFVVCAEGTLASQAPSFSEALHLQTLKIQENSRALQALPGERQTPQDQLGIIYQALVLGVQDYVNKNGFPGIILGLSGGIDSALTLAIACDALGKERVEAVMMPFKYTSTMSLEDAEAEAKALGVGYRVIPIEPMFNAFMQQLSPAFKDSPIDTTEENLQARCRGVLLMALSNKQGHLVLTTGNKSEMAVGYATLYGDMVGGYSALKDVYKTLVFDLARYRNQISPVIPERVFSRPPSAELAPDQKDSDSLPDYGTLDAILERYIEGDLSADAIVAEGFDENAVYRILRLVDRNEYKRRQAPIGVRLTKRGFGRDRRYPITSKWGPGL